MQEFFDQCEKEFINLTKTAGKVLPNIKYKSKDGSRAGFTVSLQGDVEKAVKGIKAALAGKQPEATAFMFEYFVVGENGPHPALFISFETPEKVITKTFILKKDPGNLGISEHETIEMIREDVSPFIFFSNILAK